MNSPSASNEVTTEADKIEEHIASAEGEKQPTESESENSTTDGSKLERKNEVADTGREAATEEQLQRLGQHQHNSLEPNQYSEKSPMEPQNLAQAKESEPSANQVADYEKEHTSLRLSEDPQAFIERSGELFVRQGIIPDKDKAKLDDKTTLKFNVNEGFTVIHENQNYRITTVKQESIGDLVLNRYRTQQGEEFLHIPEQAKVVPPYETPWYALSSNTRIYLEKGYKHELLQAAINRAGGEAELRRELKQRETHLCDNYLYRHLREQREAIRVDKLIPILTNLGRDLDEPNSHITAIGHKRAIENPNLPFKLNNTDGARLMASRYSDGTNCAPRGRGPVFDYANNDLECRNRVEESLREIFGGANVINKESDTGEVAKVRTSTYIVGQTLERAGAVTGEVIEQNPHVPTFILEGSREMKREWLIQASGDEGYLWSHRGKVRIGRAAEVTEILSKDMLKCLE